MSNEKLPKGEYRSAYTDADDGSTPRNMAEDTRTPERIRGEDWFQAFAYAPEGVEPWDVENVIYAVDGEHDADSWILIARLRSGKYLYLNAGCDYTGWDCRASGVSELRDSLEDMLRDCVTEDDARRFEIEKRS